MDNNLKDWFHKQLNRYFSAFANKDLLALNSLISDDIFLQDWEVEVEGREDFLNINEKLFNSVDKITVTGYTFFHGDIIRQTDGIDEKINVCFCPIKIDIDGKIMEVLDLISFDEEGNICGVIAYRQ